MAVWRAVEGRFGGAFRRAARSGRAVWEAGGASGWWRRRLAACGPTWFRCWSSLRLTRSSVSSMYSLRVCLGGGVRLAGV